MFDLFLNPHGQLRRQDFWIAFGCLTIAIIGLNMLARVIGVTTMASFWLYTLAFPVLIYSIYQVSKKRLRHMGHTARPFWVFLFLMLFLWVGLFLYFGVGEHFTVLFNNPEKHADEAWLAAQEAVMTAKLEKALPMTERIMIVPAVLFAAWLALKPGQEKQA